MTPQQRLWIRAFGLFTLVVLMVATLALPTRQAEASTIVRIRSVAFGTCFTGPTATTVNLQACFSSSNFQPWHITPVGSAYTIRSVAWGTCLWVSSGLAGTVAQLRPCGATPNDKWSIIAVGGGALLLRSVLAPNNCLTAQTPPATGLVLAPCTGAPNQQFVFF